MITPCRTRIQLYEAMSAAADLMAFSPEPDRIEDYRAAWTLYHAHKIVCNKCRQIDAELRQLERMAQ